MNRARKVVKDSVWLIGAQATTSLAGLVFLMLVARWLTDVEIAALAAREILVAAVRVVSSLGLIGTLTQRVPVAMTAGDLPLVRGYVRLGLVSQALLAIPVVAVIVLVARPISMLFFDTPTEMRLVYLLAASSLSGRIYDQLTLLLSPLDRFRALTGCRVLHDGVLRLLGLYAYSVGGMPALLGTIVVGEVLLTAGAIVVARREIFGPAVRVPLGESLRYSVPFYWNGYLHFGVMQADQLTVSALLGPRELATYFLARRLYFFLEALVNHLVTPLAPKLSALRVDGEARLSRAFARSSRLLLTVVLPPAIYVALLSGLLVEVVGDGEYPAAGPLLMIFCAAAVLYGANQLYATLIFVAGRPAATFRLNAVAGVSSVASMIAMGAAFGIWGVALSRVFAQLVTLLVGHQLSRTLIRAGLDLVAATKIMGLTGVAALPIVICSATDWHGPITMPVALIVSLGTCAWFVLRTLCVQDLELFLSSVPTRTRPWVSRALEVARISRGSATSMDRSSSDGQGRLTSRA